MDVMVGRVHALCHLGGGRDLRPGRVLTSGPDPDRPCLSKWGVSDEQPRGVPWRAFVLAGVAAVAGALVAPAAWPDGPAQLALERGDEPFAAVPVIVGIR
jgi:hypothetical protein